MRNFRSKDFSRFSCSNLSEKGLDRLLKVCFLRDKHVEKTRFWTENGPK